MFTIYMKNNVLQTLFRLLPKTFNNIFMTNKYWIELISFSEHHTDINHNDSETTTVKPVLSDHLFRLHMD